MTASNTEVLARYREHANLLGERFQALATEDVIAPIRDYLPDAPSSIIDVGAGSGRDAVWFSKLGYRVTAVEPVSELSEQAAAISAGVTIEWVEDHLPTLKKLADRQGSFDLCLLSGVWHHLPCNDRAFAFYTLGGLLRAGGTILLSLRQGGQIDDVAVFDVDPEETIALASNAGLDLVKRVATGSIQAHNIEAGVHWTWLVLRNRKEAVP